MKQTDIAANTAGKQRGRPFRKGESGNPAGKAPGTRNKATILVQALLEGEAEAVGRVAVDKALEGDMCALRLVLERLLPKKRDAPVRFKLPKLKSARDLPRATEAILEAASRGELTPAEAQGLAGILEHHRKALEISELESRVAALESGQGGSRGQ